MRAVSLGITSSLGKKEIVLQGVMFGLATKGFENGLPFMF